MSTSFLVFLALLALGCTPSIGDGALTHRPSPTLVSTPAAQEQFVGPAPCRVPPGPGASIAEAVAVVRANDRRCGRPDRLHRLCRAIAVAQLTDPALGTDHIGEHRWALAEGVAVSDGDLAVAFGILQGATAELAEGPIDERRLARWMVRRSMPLVIEPLAAAEAACSGADDQPGAVAEAADQEPGS